MVEIYETIREYDEYKALKILADHNEKLTDELNYKDKQFDTILINAIIYGFNKFIMELLMFDIDLNIQNNYGVSALMYAISRPNISTKVIDKLIEKKANLDLQCHNKITAVSYACLNKLEENAIKLIDAGTKLDLKSNTNKTTIDYVYEFNLTKVLDHLRSINRNLILESINESNTILFECFTNPLADLNTVDIIVDFVY